MKFYVIPLALFAVRCVGIATAAGTASAPEQAPVNFETHVRPILRAYCYDCHGANEKPEGGLDLRLRRLIVKGGESGPAIVPGDREASLLLQRVRDGEMPPTDKKLPAEQVKVLAAWIAAGAPTLRDEPKTIGKGLPITEEDRSFWAFQPPKRPAIPTFGSEDRVRTSIDALLLARMRERGLALSPDADKLTLLRRSTFYHTGLPPSAEEIAQFTSDSSPNAYEKLLDRLLASPHYGERWARHWLDAAGYADSDGDTGDTVRSYAYEYRDYVIDAFNNDKPFDQFIVEQLAGDELAQLPFDQAHKPVGEKFSPKQVEKVIATGFLRMAADGTANSDNPEAARNQVIADTIKIVSSSLLGLTVGCAQCHDHRYDPISQEDYYSLRAVFEPGFDWQKGWRIPSQRLVSLSTATDRAKSAAIEAEVNKIAAERAAKQAELVSEAFKQALQETPESVREPLRKAYQTPAQSRTPEQTKLLAEHPSVNVDAGNLYLYNHSANAILQKFDERIGALRATKPPETILSPFIENPGSRTQTHLFYRGDYRQPKQTVTPGDLTIAAPEGARFLIPEHDPRLATSGRRLAYARHLTDGKHPLVARVLMNRVWLNHFGKGLVDTPGDFGNLGMRPSHPELLDFLALEFEEHGWSLKRIQKLIMMSTAYRQSSTIDPAKQKLDSANAFYWRMPLRRLDAESIRDRMLATTGELNLAVHGPPVAIEEDSTGQVTASASAPRRSIYLQVRRTKPVSFLATFDAPVMELNCDRRISSTGSPQSLMLMNGEFVLNEAEAFARRVLKETPLVRPQPATSNASKPAAAWEPQLSHVWQLAFQRPITAQESALSSRFLQQQVEYLRENKHKDPEQAALANLCQQLLCANEFLYVD
jgi:mono/diheme cytochrome c family protein